MKLAAPSKEELVKAFIAGTASLELLKSESVKLNALPGMFSHIEVSGNSLPVVKYQVFDKGLMEFILIRVELALPDRITYRAFYCDTFPEPKQETEVLPYYIEPFNILLLNLYNYWPLRKKDHDIETSLIR